MKPIVQKVLDSGIIDRGTAKMLEIWGYLPDGISEGIDEGKLASATRETLLGVAEDLASEIDKEHHIRETHLDLERIKWPTEVSIFYQGESAEPTVLAVKVAATMDRMGRYYFRIDDIKKEWFVPGFYFERSVAGDAGRVEIRRETVLESQPLFVNEQPICMQVTTRRES